MDSARQPQRAFELVQFMQGLSAENGRALTAHARFDAWAVSHWRDFWLALVERYGGPLGLKGDPQPICVGDDCEHATFFPNLRLNYADALLSLSVADESAPAVSACHAGAATVSWTRGELRERVGRLAAGLRAAGMRPGDRVAAILRNDDNAVLVALAVTAVGATLCTAAPDMGRDALRDRFVQVEPRWLIAHTQARPFDTGIGIAEKLTQLLSQLPSVRHLVRVDGAPLSPHARDGFQETSIDELAGQAARLSFDWPKFPFNHPLFIMFTSGTTGPPKCIAHGAGGTLLEHVKEHRLHVDLAPGDRLFFQTGCSWMMWNWQLSALASGAQIVTYSGPVASASTLWDIAARERVTVFGTSPPYLLMSKEAGVVPREHDGYPELRAVLSTGSVLHDWQCDWVVENVKRVPVWSISGGTDIIGCFVLGSPLLPVASGESPCRSLAMDVQVRDGQLICANPFPSRPLGFLHDDDGARFHAAYFAQNPGVWTHGDHASASEAGGFRILGRIDGVLNVRGIKVSPGEIARVLLTQPGVRDVMLVEQAWHEQSRVVALVVLTPGMSLTSELVARWRGELATRLSNAHVPDLFLDVRQLPVTHSGKTSEAAARRALQGLPVENEAALRNPESLAAIREHPMLRAGDAPSATASIGEQVATVWAELFGMPQPLPADANFFELGGNSLLAARLFARLAPLTGRALPVSTLLASPTLGQLVSAIEHRSRESAYGGVFLARPGFGHPVFLVHGLSGTVMECWSLLSQLRPGRPVYGFQARGLDDELAPQASVEELARDYVTQLRTVQPEGPYCIWGFSFGGLVAFEMARRLVAEGAQVEHVGLIDTYVHRELHGFAALRDSTSRATRIAMHLSPARWPQRLRARFEPPAVLRLPEKQLRVHEAMEHALAVYAPTPLDGAPVIYLRAGVPLGGQADALPEWRRVAGSQLRIIAVPGGHLDLVGTASAAAARAIDSVLTPPADAPASARSVPPASPLAPASNPGCRTTES